MSESPVAFSKLNLLTTYVAHIPYPSLPHTEAENVSLVASLCGLQAPSQRLRFPALFSLGATL